MDNFKQNFESKIFFFLLNPGCEKKNAVFFNDKNTLPPVLQISDPGLVVLSLHEATLP